MAYQREYEQNLRHMNPHWHDTTFKCGHCERYKDNEEKVDQESMDHKERLACCRFFRPEPMPDLCWDCVRYLQIDFETDMAS